MKKMTSVILLLLMFSFISMAQKEADKKENIKVLIESRQFKFTARSVTPMSGGTINLTSTYDFSVDSMQVESWLPFYGRAYQSDYGSTEGGIKFKEVAKVLKVERNGKKDSYEIRIEVDTAKDSYKINIHAGDSGYASMSVLSNRRQSVSYYGIIEPLDE
ncbi:DUF4251 domain-containing protein [uncultured Sunxiuqinia sp.]|uniref:DUF4251 domain-containing protein n=1 Tax=uncultured Sunxiuqinia sp. TaxID=1573825 RepID=UPI002AA76009|nr:DUF4251 domain-containing protein [uncultured Sunxiuqinia sp.]